MAGVNITLANGQLGQTIQTADGVVGMVLTGQTDEGGYVIGTPILVTSLNNLVAQGITETSNAFAYRQVQDFYTEAGSGANLYLMLVGDLMAVSDMADNTNPNGASALLDFAAGKIKILGIMSDDAAVATASGVGTVITNGLNAAVYTAAANMAVMANAYFEAERPFRCIIGGTSYNNTPAALIDETAGTTNNRTAILIGDTEESIYACLGLLLGRIAAIPVQRKVSRVKTGAMSNTAAYIGTNLVDTDLGDCATIESKGFITWTMYPNVAGYFFSGDPMLTATTDDYSFLCRGRVIDKAHVLAYTVFVQEVDDEVTVNADGTLDVGFLKHLENAITSQINLTMTANNEISSCSCFIDPTQNILSTGTLNVTLSIVPVGYASNIDVELGFSNPAG